MAVGLAVCVGLVVFGLTVVAAVVVVRVMVVLVSVTGGRLQLLLTHLSRDIQLRLPSFV